MKKIFIIFIFSFPGMLISQEQLNISLQQCLKKAAINYPLADQKELLKTANELGQQINQKAFYPKFMLNGQVSYQSEVTAFPIALPNVNMPQIDKDWYKLNVDISQLIYDGGLINKQQELDQSNTDIEIQAVEVELYKVEELVKTAFFNILLLNENKKIIQLLQHELNEKLKSITSAVSNGVMQASNRDNLMAELIKIEQSIEEIELGIDISTHSLSVLTGMQLNPGVIFEHPPMRVKPDHEINRPENKLFDLQMSKIGVLKELTDLRRRPVLMGFGQLGYGRPGLNMLSNDFDPYYVIGAKLSWNILDWGKVKKEKKSLDLKNQIIQKSKDAFNLNVELLLNRKESEIKRLESLIDKDGQIVNLKKNVAAAASSQFENGVITATEYLLEKNAETKAIMDFQLHKIQLLSAKIDYQYALGNLINNFNDDI